MWNQSWACFSMLLLSQVIRKRGSCNVWFDDEISVSFALSHEIALKFQSWIFQLGAWQVLEHSSSLYPLRSFSRIFHIFTFPGRQNTDCSDISFSVKSKSSMIPTSLVISIPTLKNEKSRRQYIFIFFKFQVQNTRKTEGCFINIWRVQWQKFKHMIWNCSHYTHHKGLQCMPTATHTVLTIMYIAPHGITGLSSGILKSAS